MLASSVRITQTLGAVKDGIALRGSGNESQTFEVPTDGSEQEIPHKGAIRGGQIGNPSENENV